MDLLHEELGMELDDDNTYKVVGKCFDGIDFGPFEFIVSNYPAHTKFLIDGCVFRNCAVPMDDFRLSGGHIHIRDTVFECFSTAGEVSIKTDVTLDRVTFRGKPKRGGGIVVKPPLRGKWDDPDFDIYDLDNAVGMEPERWRDIDFILDISGYKGREVFITGYPAEKILIDPERHYRLKHVWLSDIEEIEDDSKEYRKCMWQVKRLHKSVDRVESLPPKRSSIYASSHAEVMWLRDHGFV